MKEHFWVGTAGRVSDRVVSGGRRRGWGGGAGSIYPLPASLEEEELIAGREERPAG